MNNSTISITHQINVIRTSLCLADAPCSTDPVFSDPIRPLPLYHFFWQSSLHAQRASIYGATVSSQGESTSTKADSIVVSQRPALHNYNSIS